MHTRPTRPRLRLVGTWPDIAADTAAANSERQRRQAIIRENRRAAQQAPLAPTDPRWALAVRAQSQLQGTAMTPERRERVQTTARQLGIRPFDANVIIAVVQDHARRGLDLSQVTTSLSEVPNPRERSSSARHGFMRSPLNRMLLAAVLAAAMNALLILWLLSPA